MSWKLTSLLDLLVMDGRCAARSVFTFRLCSHDHEIRTETNICSGQHTIPEWSFSCTVTTRRRTLLSQRSFIQRASSQQFSHARRQFRDREVGVASRLCVHLGRGQPFLPSDQDVCTAIFMTFSRVHVCRSASMFTRCFPFFDQVATLRRVT